MIAVRSTVQVYSTFEINTRMQIIQLVHRETSYKGRCCILSPLRVADGATYPPYNAVSPWTVLYRDAISPPCCF
ncbi:unnamed protein product [Caretta caretta]